MPIAEQNRRAGEKGGDGTGLVDLDWKSFPSDDTKLIPLTSFFWGGLVVFWSSQSLKSTRNRRHASISEILNTFCPYGMSFLRRLLSTAQPPLLKPEQPLAFEQSGSLNLWWRAAGLHDPQWLELLYDLQWLESVEANFRLPSERLICTGIHTIMNTVA